MFLTVHAEEIMWLKHLSAVLRMYHQATVTALLSRLWCVRKRARQTVKKLLSSLGGSSLAQGLVGELRVVINKHKVRGDEELNDYTDAICIC